MPSCYKQSLECLQQNSVWLSYACGLESGVGGFECGIYSVLSIIWASFWEGDPRILMDKDNPKYTQIRFIQTYYPPFTMYK